MGTPARGRLALGLSVLLVSLPSASPALHGLSMRTMALPGGRWASADGSVVASMDSKNPWVCATHTGEVHNGTLSGSVCSGNLPKMDMGGWIYEQLVVSADGRTMVGGNNNNLCGFEIGKMRNQTLSGINCLHTGLQVDANLQLDLSPNGQEVVFSYGDEQRVCQGKVVDLAGAKCLSTKEGEEWQGLGYTKGGSIVWQQAGRFCVAKDISSAWTCSSPTTLPAWHGDNSSINFVTSHHSMLVGFTYGGSRDIWGNGAQMLGCQVDASKLKLGTLEGVECEMVGPQVTNSWLFPSAGGKFLLIKGEDAGNSQKITVCIAGGRCEPLPVAGLGWSFSTDYPGFFHASRDGSLVVGQNGIGRLGARSMVAVNTGSLKTTVLPNYQGQSLIVFPNGKVAFEVNNRRWPVTMSAVCLGDSLKAADRGDMGGLACVGISGFGLPRPLLASPGQDSPYLAGVFQKPDLGTRYVRRVDSAALGSTQSAGFGGEAFKTTDLGSDATAVSGDMLVSLGFDHTWIYNLKTETTEMVLPPFVEKGVEEVGDAYWSANGEVFAFVKRSSTSPYGSKTCYGRMSELKVGTKQGVFCFEAFPSFVSYPFSRSHYQLSPDGSKATWVNVSKVCVGVFTQKAPIGFAEWGCSEAPKAYGDVTRLYLHPKDPTRGYAFYKSYEWSRSPRNSWNLVTFDTGEVLLNQPLTNATYLSQTYYMPYAFFNPDFSKALIFESASLCSLDLKMDPPKYTCEGPRGPDSYIETPVVATNDLSNVVVLNPDTLCHYKVEGGKLAGETCISGIGPLSSYQIQFVDSTHVVFTSLAGTCLGDVTKFQSGTTNGLKCTSVLPKL